MSTQPAPDSYLHTENRRKMINLAEQNGIKSVIDTTRDIICDHESYNKQPQLLQQLYDMALSIGLDGYINQQSAIISRADSRPDLDTIKCPVLVVYGENDALIPPTHSIDLVRQLRELYDPDLTQIRTVGSSYSIANRRIQLVMIPQVGHIVTLEAPELTTEILIDFIDH